MYQDCDDADDAVYPGAADACYDGVDADCGGDDDDDCDRDGESAEAAGGRDCDDGDGARGPGAPEGWHDRSVDNDCDGSIEDPVSLDLEGADVTYIAPTGAGWVGYRVGAIGDIDGDGIEEVWALAPYSSEAGAYAGAAYVIPSTYAAGALPDTTPHVSGTAGLILGAAGTSLDAGAATSTEWLASDGFGFILASEVAEGEAGAGWLWETDLWTADVAVSDIQLGLRGEQPGDAAGSGFALVADRNGDGESDLLFGAPRNDAAGADAGRVYVQHAP